jgi:D-alanyl-D-alanine carboxypeptidase (penicillin-binding protein 5/6)
MKQINFSIYLFLTFLFLFNTIVLAENDIYVWSNNSTSVKNSIETDSSNANSDNNENFLNLESGSAILVEQTTGQILYSYNIHEQLRPASVTKLMSILLIMEAIDNGSISLTDTVSCSETASSMGGSQIWLDPRETLTVDEMLKAICVASANDCVVAMAEYIAGSQEAFVQMMNDKAKVLGMNDTVFKNCHGLDEDGHLTSSYDIALMSCELLNKYPSITNYTTIWTDSLRDGKTQLVNTNKLIRTYKGATGLKTGSTSLALYNLSASATRDNLSLIAVIMKAPSTKIRFSEAQKLLDYGFNTFTFKQIATKGDILKNISVEKGILASSEIVIGEDTGILINKTDSENIEQIINLPETIIAPVSENEQVGSIDFLINGEIIASTPLVAKNNVNKINIFNMSKFIIYKWINLLRN